MNFYEIKETYNYLRKFKMKILLTSFAELPETSIHVLEKKAHEPSIKRI